MKRLLILSLLALIGTAEAGSDSTSISMSGVQSALAPIQAQQQQAVSYQSLGLATLADLQAVQAQQTIYLVNNTYTTITNTNTMNCTNTTTALVKYVFPTVQQAQQWGGCNSNGTLIPPTDTIQNLNWSNACQIQGWLIPVYGTVCTQ